MTQRGLGLLCLFLDSQLGSRLPVRFTGIIFFIFFRGTRTVFPQLTSRRSVTTMKHTTLRSLFLTGFKARVRALGLIITTLVVLNMLVPVLLPDTQSQASAAVQQEYPVGPYIDPNFLTELPWGKQSFYVQPWRAYMETVPAIQLQDGIGVNYNLPGEADH